jgi:hypothetical protein
VLRELTGHLFVDSIHFLIARNQGAGGDGVAVDERIQSGFEHIQRKLGHSGEINDDLNGRLLAEVAGAFGDFSGLVADAFQVLRNFHCDGDQTQVAGEWRFGEQLNGHFVDLNFELVDDVVAFLDAQGELVVSLKERAEGFVHGGFGVARHGEQLLLQFVQIHINQYLVHAMRLSRSGRSHNLPCVFVSGW